MIKAITEALRQFSRHTDAPNHQWVHPYNPDKDPATHQFLLFLKPELVEPDVRTEKVLELIFATLKTWSVEIGAARLLNGKYLSKHRIMDQHYGVINQISHQGRDAISAQAEHVLRESFAPELEQGAIVIGAHPFLEQETCFTSLALTTLSDNVGTTKLAGGTYALNMKLLGQRFLILNPFHPYQLQPYYAPANTLIVLEGLTPSPWRDLRQELAGATDPARAEKGSLRELFLQRKDTLALKDVSQGANGIHLSAGPLEGMVEIQRFFSEHDQPRSLDVTQTCLGHLLQEKGLDAKAITRLAQNPVLPADETHTPAFDLTEEMDAREAADLLTQTVM